ARDLPARTRGRPREPRPRRRLLLELARHHVPSPIRPRLPQVPRRGARAGLPLQQPPHDNPHRCSRPEALVLLPLRLHRHLPPAGCRDRRKWRVLDSRHGLALFDTPKSHEDFLVYDLLTGEHWEIHADPKCHYFMWWPDDDDDLHACLRCNATLLCAKDRCDHLDCHGGPFRVAFVGCDYTGRAAHAAVYSSETRQWTDVTSVEHEHYIHYTGHSAVVGDKAITLMGAEDGMPLFASVVKPRLLLWSLEAGPGGAARWTRHRVIELKSLLPTTVLLDNSGVTPVGFAEGVGVIFLSTKAGLYTIELSSRRSKKVHGRQSMEKAIPYMSFYTGEWGPLLASDEASPAVGGGTTI
ncbi:hypothetical protein CFC21_058779, partial [Triticum aestivum]